MSGLTTDRDDPALQNIQPSGMQEKYLVLSDDERAKGFVRPVRRAYVHVKCGTSTKMGQELAETYARDPGFYSGTFCYKCGTHFPLKDAEGKPAFTWVDDGSPVGS